MKRFYLIVNPTRDRGLQAAKDVEAYLASRGCSFKTHISEKSENDIYTEADSIPEDTECILVLGGDGTMIQAARDLAELDIPMLGINMGHMGYLTDVERGDIIPSLQALIEDRYTEDGRMMITGDIIKDFSGENAGDTGASAVSGCPAGSLCRDSALNDIVVHRSGYMRVIDYKVSVNGKFLKSYRADGIIVSTPTGSTAYSLSAGGPIVEPGSRLFIITPICPHTLNSRSIVLSSDDEIFISTGEEDTAVSFDGREKRMLPVTGGVRITRSDKVARIVRLHDDSFLNVLHNKFIDTV